MLAQLCWSCEVNTSDWNAEFFGELNPDCTRIYIRIGVVCKARKSLQQRCVSTHTLPTTTEVPPDNKSVATLTHLSRCLA